MSRLKTAIVAVLGVPLLAALLRDLRRPGSSAAAAPHVFFSDTEQLLQRLAPSVLLLLLGRLRSADGSLEVRASMIAGAGRGLFSRVELRPGAPLGTYRGDTHRTREVQSRTNVSHVPSCEIRMSLSVCST